MKDFRLWLSGAQKISIANCRIMMKRWESLVDQKIREAMEQGEFENLAGQGAPIDLTVNPFEDPDWRTAHRMLRNAGFAPAWIEERKDIDAELETARASLSRVWLILENARGTSHEPGATIRWETALAAFRGKVRELNQRLNDWNLKAPAPGFQRKRIDVDREIDLIRS
jgi:DnaJ homolog subfamily C member 28